MFSKIGKQKYVCYIIITLTWQERCDESQIVPSFWDSLRYRISGQQNYGKENEL